MSATNGILEFGRVLAAGGGQPVDPSVISKFGDYFKNNSEHILAIVFIDIAIVMVVARLVGGLFKKIRQPAVVGEILAGIMLGPSLLGAIGVLFGAADNQVVPNWLFPPEVRPFLNVLANVGLIIFMFIVGLELDMRLIRGRERVAAGISISSIVLPFALGIGLAFFIHTTYGVVNGQEVAFWPFALFLGVAMSITAFPVLARILTERGMHRTPVGAIALASAAIDDIVAWSLLALVLAIVSASSGGGPLDMVRIAGFSLLFVAVMFLVVKPQLNRLVTAFQKAGRLTPTVLSIVLIGVLVSSYLTSIIGIHGIFGAFVFGAIMPREAAADFTHEILEKLEQVSVLLLLPLFFIVTGLNVDITEMFRSPELFAVLVAVLVVACTGKFLGASLAARAQGYNWSRAFSVGTLMNTRGLTELVILNAGLAAGVLNNQLFTVMVCMAVLTTVITEPLLRVFYPEKQLRADIAEAEKASLGELDAYRVVVSVGDVDSVAATNLVDLAVALVGDERPAQVVLSRFQPQAQKLEVGSGMVGELGSFADSLGGLHQLTQRCEQAGVDCLVRSQFSADEVGDLMSQAEAMEADVLLLAEVEPVGRSGTGDGDAVGTGDARLTAAGLPFTVITVADADSRIDIGPGHAVVVVAAEAPEAELEVAVRLAATRGAPVAVSGASGRRSAKHLDSLLASVPSVTTRRDLPPPDAQGVVVRTTGPGADPGGLSESAAVLTVHAPPDGRSRWHTLAKRLGESGGAAAVEDLVDSATTTTD